MLVVALVDERDRPHQRRVRRIHRILQIHRQAQVLLPVRVVEPRGVRAHEQHHLRARGIGQLGHCFIDHAVRAQRVAVQVDDDAQARVLVQVLLHGRARAVVRARVARVVVDRPVVQHLQPGGRERVGQHVAHVHNIIIGVLRAARVARGIEVAPRGGEGFARVRVHDEDLRFARRQHDGRALLQQRGRIDRDVRLVFDAQPARDARRHDRQPVGRRGGRVLVGVGVRGGGGCRGRRGRGRAEHRCRLRCGGCVHRRRTQLHAHRCQQQLLRVEPEPQPVRERRAARRSRCDLQAEHGQPHAGQFLPQRHICSPPIAFSTIYMVSGVELCHRICYTEHRNFSKEASS